MGYLRGFVPWIVSAAVSPADWRWGAIGGLLSGLVLLLQDRRRGVGGDALVLETSSVVYFAVIGAVAVAAPHSALSHHTDVLSFTWLAVTAWGSLAVRRPFTLGIAKRQTPREYWDTPAFVRVNDAVTGAWGAGFTFIGVALVVCGAVHAPGWTGVAAHVVGLVAPAWFTKVHPARVQARLQAQGLAGQAHAPASAR
ncbi:hypothetical protein [Streptacidiphilus anmyonensis]|uniref:hypothetical protein n=1 Tax=Streptacidiphilus anmyonensis TaxID=405782 RepID=UPI0005A9991F|nr:hypothetical protein [Streptacidiphilus anmyonensis]